MINDKNNYLFAIIENCSNQHIGNIKLGPINFIHSYADISYFIGQKDCWGNGYASEAIRLLTNFGFKKLNLHKIRAGVYASNVASQKTLEKSGYKFEAKFLRCLKNGDNWEDHFWYGIFNE